MRIELLNEPPATTVPVDVLASYYSNGYETVRKHSSTTYVIMCRRIENADPHELYQINDAFSNIVVDVHYYNLFDDYFDNKTAQDNIDFILKDREPQVETLNSTNGPLIFVGEWTNEWKVQGASRSEYQQFCDAQLQAYEKASFGWSYWTLKNEEKHWDFEWNIKHNYLRLAYLMEVRHVCCCDPECSATAYEVSILCPGSGLQTHKEYLVLAPWKCQA